MKRFFLELAYDGSGFHGWQSQSNARGIQNELEKCLGAKTGQEVRLTGCGRTDTGVHARQYFAHFDLTDDAIDPTTALFRQQLNLFLPEGIVVFRIFRVSDTAHARFDAVSRTYRYYISREKYPFNRNFSYFVYGEMNQERMQEACIILMEYTDFTSFSKLHSAAKTNICHLTEASFTMQHNELVFTITADRFLRNMVRAIVGTMIDLGRNKITLQDFRHIIELKDRAMAGFSVPGHALFLEKVVYPEGLV